MALDHIRYDILTQEALRGVVRTVLADAAKNGLPGEHHFKITFDTTAPGVRLSERMRAQYKETMTIILQHQFWDLVVGDDGFEVGLSFGGVPERLAIPFAAVTAFYDPAVQFGFQFETEGQMADASAATKAADERDGAVSHPAAEQTKPDALPAPAQPQQAPAGAQAGGGEVVRLDRFRKK
jgi:uncharacterized protein